MIIVYSKPNCVQCEQTKKYLSNNNVEYAMFDVVKSRDAYQIVKKLGYTSVPVVVSGDTHFSGFQPDLLKTLISE